MNGTIEDRWRFQQVKRQIDKAYEDEQSAAVTLSVIRQIVDMSPKLVELYVTKGWDMNVDPAQDLGHSQRGYES